MKVIYFNCTCSHFSHKYRCNAICKIFFSSVFSMTGAKCFVCNLPCRFSASFRSNQAIKIFGTVAEDCVTPIWKSILIHSFKYCTVIGPCVASDGVDISLSQQNIFVLTQKVFLLIQIPSLHFGSCLTQSNGKVCLSRLQKVD